jgi:hypothetical protein
MKLSSAAPQATLPGLSAHIERLSQIHALVARSNSLFRAVVRFILHVAVSIGSTGFGTEGASKNRAECQLHLLGVYRLCLPAERLALEPLEFVEHERVELPVLLTLLLSLVARLSQRREFCFERSDPRLLIIVLLRWTLAHAPKPSSETYKGLS